MPRGRLLNSGRGSRSRTRSSHKQESEVAADLGGNRTPGSGNQWAQKGDVKTARFLVECKTTENTKQITLKLEDWKKIVTEAIMERKEAVMQLQIGEHKLAVLDWELFLELNGPS